MEKLSALKNAPFLLPCFCPAMPEKCNLNKSCLGKPQRHIQMQFAHPGLRSTVTGAARGVVQGPLSSAAQLVLLCWLGRDLTEMVSSPLLLGSPRTCFCGCYEVAIMKRYCGCLQAGTDAGSYDCNGFTVFGKF